MFQKLGVCSDYGEIAEDFLSMIKETELDYYDEDDDEEIIAQIEEILTNYTDEQIVDKLWGVSSDSEHDYAQITTISTASIIKL